MAANATTLVDTMVAAYHANASLQAERFKARASDEGVPKALSGYRPRVVGDAFYGASRLRSNAPAQSREANESYGYGASIEQPLFDGFQTRHAVREAEQLVLSSREDLRALENEILFETAMSYLDVLRDEGIVLYRKQNVTSLKRHLVGVRERLQHGQVTVTDIEQSKLRAANARSSLEQARAKLRTSQLRFARVTRVQPRGLRMPALPQAHLPASLRQAALLAEANNPIIASSRFRSKAAREAVARVRGEFLPSAHLVAGYDRAVNDASRSVDRDGFSLLGRVRVPFYQGGEVSARVRQAKNAAAGRDRESEAATLKIGEAVGGTWAEFKAAKARVRIDKDGVTASQKALEGVREEYGVGRRSVLDVLDAERELIDARIGLLKSTRDLHVSAYALIRSTGNLTIDRLAPGTKTYRPENYYRQVRGKWWGTALPLTGEQEFLGGGTHEASDGWRHARRYQLGMHGQESSSRTRPKGWEATVIAADR
ncbi:MAG: TolC family outer membrane protein [Alphaproteobacteria bacterium]|nr:TolC family outer membrane protein [Alphaproteobacteria bacterium]